MLKHFIVVGLFYRFLLKAQENHLSLFLFDRHVEVQRDCEKTKYGRHWRLF